MIAITGNTVNIRPKVGPLLLGELNDKQLQQNTPPWGTFLARKSLFFMPGFHTAGDFA